MRARIAVFTALSLCLVTNVQADTTFSLSSTATSDQGALPVLYTCDGKNTSPQIRWSGAPDKTQTFALILSDPDAPNGTFYHWVLYNIPKNISKLSEGIKTLPAGTLTGNNSAGESKYKGPCPPKGANHHYIFTLYALDTKLNLAAGADASALQTAMQSHVLSKAEFTALYSRWTG